MNPKLKETAESTFWMLLIVYTLLILVVSLGFLSKYTLHFEIFALIISVLGISILFNDKDNKEKSKPFNKRIHYSLFALAILLIVLLRTIPYLGNSIPIGYDAGIYKYGIESFYSQGFGVADWVKSAFEPGFLYLTYALKWFFSSQAILTWVFILFNLILGISIYFFSKEYFGKSPAIISILIYSVSIIQFKVFALMYYKNIIALSALLWALYFLNKDKRLLFILFGALVGIIHRPTFYIFGLSYFFYAFASPINKNNQRYNPKKLINNILNGIFILILTAIFYIGFYHQAILPLISPVAQSFINPGESPGTFINFFQYQFSTLAYLPFAILGFFAIARRKQFNLLFFLALITASIVYFQFFFFNRFIIHLDIFLIILASLGFSVLIENKKKLGTIILIVMLFSAGFVTLNESLKAKPGITQEQLTLIQQLSATEENASILVISSEYSPYVLAYSERKTIAPGLFEENKWNLSQWNQFWTTNSTEETKTLMSVYNKPIYLFTATKSFNNPCFSIYLEENTNKIYKYLC